MTLLFIGALLNNLYRTPADMEYEFEKEATGQIKNLTERIQILEAERQQLLAFDFRPEDDKYLQIVDAREGGHRRKFRVGRVAVKNESKRKSIKNVQATLINYTKYGEKDYNTLNIRLSDYSTGKDLEDLPARRSHTYDLFRLKESGTISHISLGPAPDGSYKQIPTGKYKLKITVSGNDMPPLIGFFWLEVNEDGEVIYGPYNDLSKQIKSA